MSTLTAARWAVDEPLDAPDKPSRWRRHTDGVRVEGGPDGDLTVHTANGQAETFAVDFLQTIQPLSRLDALRVVTDAGEEYYCTEVTRGAFGTNTLQCRLYDSPDTVDVEVATVDTIDVASGYGQE